MCKTPLFLRCFFKGMWSTKMRWALIVIFIFKVSLLTWLTLVILVFFSWLRWWGSHEVKQCRWWIKFIISSRNSREIEFMSTLDTNSFLAFFLPSISFCPPKKYVGIYVSIVYMYSFLVRFLGIVIRYSRYILNYLSFYHNYGLRSRI